MPPIVPRKRLRESPSPKEERSHKAKKPKAESTTSARRKATLYDDLDATSTAQSKSPHSALRGLDASDSESSLTSLSESEDDFEDVLPPKAGRVEDSDDEDIEFEDVEAPALPIPDAPAPTGDLELTLNRDTRLSLTNQYGDKKGPTKRERKVRNASHCVHVLLLMWHNAVRNSWLCDPEVQATMISHLPPKLWDEVDRWRVNSGLVKPEPKKISPKGKGKQKTKGKKADDRKARDWGNEARRLEEGAVDMSHGDPLFRLMKALTAWWKQRFRITKPGLRKWGYMALERLDRLTKAHAADEHDPARFGERISSLEIFRHCARICEGSRDVGAQLFTALLRGLGLEARMVANIQSLGFGWNKYEDAEPEKTDNNDKDQTPKDSEKENGSSKKTNNTKPVAKKAQSTATKNTRSAKSSTNSRKKPLVISSSDSDELELEYKDTDDESVVDVKVTPIKRPTPLVKFDKDLEYPHYWTEVLSPVTNKYLPVDAIVKNLVGTNRELIECLEPRGAKTDKARQIMAYVVGFSQDGTAKDVTVRYLKRNLMPGRTKGARMPIEKVPVYNRHGKVKRYEQFDWAKTALSGYRRGSKMCPVTEVDELEDTTDLTPAKPEKKQVKEGEETLQYYKQSKEFVLERHFKREEALKPGAKPVKVFKNKGKGSKVEEEDVYRRSDVVNVKSAETWHKQGRAPLAGEQPLKRVPYRAATTNRRREIAEAEAATGQKVLQGLFSYEQTEWIIPPPIKDGVIPKNDYGNIDLFAEHMCPEGAIHVPYKGAIRVCKRLGIDYAEAVVDFEFGHRMAVPVIQGVVIAEENYDNVIEEVEKDEIERKRKEDEKRRKAAHSMWRKFLMGMRIAERIRQEYGEIDESISVFGHSRDAPHMKKAEEVHDEEMAGGFLPEGYEDEEEAEAEKETYHASNFFQRMEDDEDGDDGLVVEDHAMAVDDKEHRKLDKPDENDENETEQAELDGNDQKETEQPEPEDTIMEEEKEEEADITSPVPPRKGKPRGPKIREPKPIEPEQTTLRRSTRHRKTVIMDSEDSENDEDIEDVYIDSEGGG